MATDIRSTCGNCKFSRIIPADISKRLCVGAPPHVMATPKGFVNVRPVVLAKDDACALHQRRVGQDLEVREPDRAAEVVGHG